MFSTKKLLSKIKPNFSVGNKDTFKSVCFLPQNPQRLAAGGLRTEGFFKHSEKDKPLISIVTVVYNGQKHIEETILSVLNQSYDNVEYIIIDGGSTDDTLNIIKKYNDSIDYWISERDDGISDAFNKGIRCCSGQLVGLINADDYYEANSFECVIEGYLNTSGESEKIIYGKTKKVTIDGYKQVKRDNKLSWCISVPFSHCSSFLTMTYYKKFGLFNTKFKIGMDVDLLMRGLKTADYSELHDFIATQRDGGVSDVLRLEGYEEYRKISKNYFGNILSYLGYLLKVTVFYKNKVLK
jgi:glycosyltransferase involved in cell wall biosynthesis